MLMGIFTNSRLLKLAEGRKGRTSVRYNGTGATSIRIEKEYSVVEIDSTGATDHDFSLPDGEVPGERILAVLATKASTANAVITPDTLAGGTTVTLSAVGQMSELVWTDVGWCEVGGGTVA